MLHASAAHCLFFRNKEINEFFAKAFDVTYGALTATPSIFYIRSTWKEFYIRLEKEERDGFIYVQHLISFAAPDAVQIDLTL